MCNRDADLIKKLQNEKASLMAEVEDLKTKEEKHKKEEDEQKVTKEKQKIVFQILQEKVKKLTKEKEALAEEQEEETRKVRTEMQTEIDAMTEQLIHSKSENQELFTNFKTMEKKYNSFKEFFQRVIQFAPTNLE